MLLLVGSVSIILFDLASYTD